MKRLFYIAMAMLPAAAAAMTYPPYEIFVGTTSGTPQLTYTKVCEPGRTGEANASYVILGSYYPARQALANTAYAGAVVIPAYIGGLPVRKINDSAFNVCQKMGSVKIPATVREIGACAFAECWNLSNVTFAAGSGLTTIGEAAFSNCTVLATATIQSNVTSIAANAFYGTALATVYVSKGDTSHIRGLVQGSGYSSPVTYIELGDEPVVTEDWPENPASVEGQTAAAAFGVTGELANAKADDLATWAKAKGVDYTNRETIIPDAFLLNCANTAAAVATATEDAEEAIKITAITIVNGVPQLTYASEYGNGQVVIQGSATIGSTASWHDGKQSGDRFFKTVLRLKSSNE